MAAFFEASVMYQLNKKAAVRLLLEVRPAFYDTKSESGLESPPFKNR